MKIKTKCNCCNAEIEKDHWHIVEGKPSYCNRKCANIKTADNKWKDYIPKNERGICEKCGKKRDIRNKTKLCQDCLNLEKKNKVLSMTIGELREKYKFKTRWYSAEIRNFCRNHNANLTILPCRKCGYDKHIELCHIKPVNSYEDSATIREVNDPANIVVLCPNHHWEFDNGHLSLEEIGG